MLTALLRPDRTLLLVLSARFCIFPPNVCGPDEPDFSDDPPLSSSVCADCESESFCCDSCVPFIRAFCWPCCWAFFWAFSCAFFFAAFFSAATLSFWARSRSALLTDWSSELDVSVMASVWPLGVLVNLPSAYFSATDNTSFTYSSEWL